MKTGRRLHMKFQGGTLIRGCGAYIFIRMGTGFRFQNEEKSEFISSLADHIKLDEDMFIKL